MATHTIKEATAASAVGTDLMDGDKLQTSSLVRRVRQLGIVGSAAINDCAIELFYGSHFIGRFYNTHAGANVIPLADSDLIPVGGMMPCPANEPIHIFVADASGTNPVYVTLVIDEFLPQPSAPSFGGYRRRSY
jgi:hypothetical protein